MLIRDTKEYAELAKLHELHDSYQKHKAIPGRQTSGYNIHICSGCGLPFDEDKGTSPDNMSTVYLPYNQQNSRKEISAIPAAVFARMLEAELRQASLSGDCINYRMLQLKDQLPIAEYHKALVKSTAVNAADLYLFATKILAHPAEDIHAALLRGLTTPPEGYMSKYAQRAYAQALLAWHHFFKTKPDKATFKAAVTKIDMNDRALWSRLAGLQMATSYRFNCVQGAIYSYLLLRDKDKKRYNDIAWMTKTFESMPTVVLMYYKDTGRVLAPLTGEDAVVKSRLIDGCATPTAEDQKAMGDVYHMVYGSGTEKLDRIDNIEPRTWRAALCPSFEDFLRREEGHEAGRELEHHCIWAQQRGFAEELDEDANNA